MRACALAPVLIYKCTYVSVSVCMYVLRMHMHALTDAYSQVHDVLVEYKRTDVLTQWVVAVRQQMGDIR